MVLVGRQREIEILTDVLNSKKAEFLALYGRRRVGKTFLIREFFKKKKDIFYFDCSGQKDASIDEQIENFFSEIDNRFQLPAKIMRFGNWNQAFQTFTKLILERKEKKLVIFIDELPWFASRKSNFLQALDYFWNQNWSKDPRIKLIVCGSASSWMIENLIQAKGGLHNRITRQILLKPFCIKEVVEYAKSQKIKLVDRELLRLYMVLGGVPYYWSLIPKGRSSFEIIDYLFFRKEAELKLEFSRLFKSLFDNHEIHGKIVHVLGKTKKGMDRNELLKKCNIKTGGTAKQYLNNLEYSGFIEGFVPLGNKKKNTMYRLVDEFSLFHLYFEKNQSSVDLQDSFWSNKLATPKINTWAGYAFENFCLRHRNEIAKALGIENTATGAHSWGYHPSNGKVDEKGAQIDLLFTRKDNCINLIELKYSNKVFVLDKNYAKELANKVEIFKEKTQFKGQIFTTIISPEGVKKGLWGDEVLDSSLSFDDILRHG